MEKNNKNSIFFEKQDGKKWIEHRFKPCDNLKIPIKEYMILECAQNTVLETLPSTSFSLNYILKGSVSLSQANGLQIDLPKAVSFGITQKFFHFTFSDYTTLFVVIFNPGFASTIINKPLNEFFEKFIPIDTFFDHTINLTMIRKLQNQNSYENMVRIMEDFLLQKITMNSLDVIIYDSISKISNHKGLISITEMVHDFPISRDTFEKRFRHLVGTTPKKYASIIRFRHLFEKPQENKRLTEIALEAGYYDQSHFIKDFKFCTGRLPSDCL